MTEPGRPQADEYNPYYHKYIERVPDGLKPRPINGPAARRMSSRRRT